MILCGASAYPRVIDFKKFREIANEVFWAVRLQGDRSNQLNQDFFLTLWSIILVLTFLSGAPLS